MTNEHGANEELRGLVAKWITSWREAADAIKREHIYVARKGSPIHAKWVERERSYREHANDMEYALKEAQGAERPALSEEEVARCHEVLNKARLAGGGWKVLFGVEVIFLMNALGILLTRRAESPATPVPQAEPHGEVCCENGNFGDGHQCMKSRPTQAEPSAEEVERAAKICPFHKPPTDLHRHRCSNCYKVAAELAAIRREAERARDLKWEAALGYDTSLGFTAIDCDEDLKVVAEDAPIIDLAEQAAFEKADEIFKELETWQLNWLNYKGLHTADQHREIVQRGRSLAAGRKEGGR